MADTDTFDQKLIVILVSVLLSTLISILMYRLNLFVQHKNKMKEACGRVEIFCEYLIARITNYPLLNESDDFLKIFISEYALMQRFDERLLKDYMGLLGIYIFLKSDGYKDDTHRRERDIILLCEMRTKYVERRKSKFPKLVFSP